MRTFPDLRMRGIVSGAQRAQELLDRGEHQEARDAFTDVRARAAKLGLAGHARRVVAEDRARARHG